MFFWSGWLIIQLTCINDFQCSLLIFSQWSHCWWLVCICLTPGSLCHCSMTCQPCFCSCAFWIEFLVLIQWNKNWEQLSSGMLAGILSKGLGRRRLQHGVGRDRWRWKTILYWITLYTVQRRVACYAFCPVQAWFVAWSLQSGVIVQTLLEKTWETRDWLGHCINIGLWVLAHTL